MPGCGVEAMVEGTKWRLGRAGWALEKPHGQATGTVLARDGVELAAFRFADRLRPGAAEAVAALKAGGIGVELVSGDRAEAVGQIAKAVGAERFSAAMLPGDKTARLARLAAEGHKDADGRRRPQRRAGAGRRPRLDGAGERGRHRPKCRRLRLPAREPGGGSGRAGRLEEIRAN